MRTVLIFPFVLAVMGANIAADVVRVYRDRQIVIPELTAREEPLDQVLERLKEASVLADKEKIGINIVNLTEEPLRSRRVTINVRNRSVRDICDLIGSMLALWISSDGNTIEVRKSDRVINPAEPGG
jgi:hypothetical protein